MTTTAPPRTVTITIHATTDGNGRVSLGRTPAGVLWTGITPSKLQAQAERFCAHWVAHIERNPAAYPADALARDFSLGGEPRDQPHPDAITTGPHTYTPVMVRFTRH